MRQVNADFPRRSVATVKIRGFFSPNVTCSDLDQRSTWVCQVVISCPRRYDLLNPRVAQPAQVDLELATVVTEAKISLLDGGKDVLSNRGSIVTSFTD
jgi:hypothetical protein